MMPVCWGLCIISSRDSRNEVFDIQTGGRYDEDKGRNFDSWGHSMRAIINGRVLVPDEAGDFVVQEDSAVIYGENIRKIISMKEYRRRTEQIPVYDADGCYVSPGFINIHIHGCGGADTMDDTAGALMTMSRRQAETGVTAFLPTTMTYDFPTIYRALYRIRSAMQKPQPGAVILGCNMEGPFISKSRKGAQAAENIVRADFAKIAAYTDIIRIITIAPEELAGDYSFVDQCRAHGILVSAGHSSADYDTAFAAITQHGIAHITHLFNGMPPLHHRQPGLAGAALDTEACCEVIADNVHIHPAAQRLIWHAKQGRNIILITDSLRACMLGEGESELGGQKVFVKGQVARLADGTIAGSVLTMDRAIANFAANAGLRIEQAVELVTKVPAAELGVSQYLGAIAPDMRADMTVFDDHLQIMATMVRGECVYQQKR